jgi:hypothetical protein
MAVLLLVACPSLAPADVAVEAGSELVDDALEAGLDVEAEERKELVKTCSNDHRRIRPRELGAMFAGFERTEVDTVRWQDRFGARRGPGEGGG